MVDTAKRRLVLGNLRINLENGEVSTREGSSELPPRVQALLLLLCEHANQLVTRDLIMQRVWSGRVVEDAALTNAVWLIRRALGDSEKRIIQTRSKRGYILTVEDCAWIDESEGADPVWPSAPGHPASNIDTAFVRSDACNDAELDSPESSRRTHAHASDIYAALEVAGSVESAFPEPPGTGLTRANTRRRLLMAVFSATLALCLGGLAVFLWSDLRQSPMATPSRKVLMLGVEAPSDAEWLEDRIFRTVGVVAIPRQYELVALQANPAANPFRATQLYITIEPAETNRYRLRMAIVRGSGQRHQSSRVVSLREVDGIVNDFVADKLEGRVSRWSPALDEYVAARAYESRYAYASALDRYAKAVVQDPSWAEARVAYAERLHESGRTQEALAQLQALPERSSLSEDLRCRSVLLEIEIQNGREDGRCGPAATAAAAISDRNGEAALRALEYTQPDELDPLTWLEREHTAMYALVSEKHLDEAAARIADAKRVATSAGWLHAAVELGVYGAPLSLSRHDTEGANAIYGDGAAAMEALGDMDMALDMRIMALRIGNSRLGGETEAARSATRELIARARAVGNRRSESFALETELRFFRHDPVEWRKRYEQIRRLGQQYFGERERIQTEQRLLYYAIDMHAYAMVLAGVERIEASGVDDGQSRLWNGMLRANAQFATGDVPGAVRSVLSMQKDDYDLRDADSCLLAWIFTEDARLELAEGMLRACPYASFDRDAHARYGYRGRYAQAKIFLHKGDTEAAWRTMRDGIDEFMLRDQPTLAEYKAVAFLGAHALLLPYADLRLASAVLARVQPVARQETADLDLRLQTHLLEWRLCVRKQGQACGDMLLHDAPEDGLELQLSRELLSTMTASRDDRSMR